MAILDPIDINSLYIDVGHWSAMMGWGSNDEYL